jgi:hypothetical protein
LALLSFNGVTIMIGDVGDLLHTAVYIFSGWHYLLSSSFRKQTHQRWKLKGNLTLIFDIAIGTFGIWLTLALLWIIIFDR